MAGKVAYPPKTKRMLRRILNEVYLINPVIAAQLEFSALTGLRCCDASKIKVSDLFINGQVRDSFTVIQQKVYSKKLSCGASKVAARKAATLVISFNDQAKEVIKEIIDMFDIDVKKPSALIFESSVKKGKPFTIQYINRTLNRVAIKLKLNFSLTTHSFRKSYSRMLIKGGANVSIVQKLLGHASLTSTEHYLNTFMGEAEAYTDKINF